MSTIGVGVHPHVHDRASFVTFKASGWVALLSNHDENGKWTSSKATLFLPSVSDLTKEQGLEVVHAYLDSLKNAIAEAEEYVEAKAAEQ